MLIPGTTFDCEDSETWHQFGEPGKNCAWVAAKQSSRCDLVGQDASLASYACPVACGARCGDSNTWAHAQDTSKTFNCFFFFLTLLL